MRWKVLCAWAMAGAMACGGGQTADDDGPGGGDAGNDVGDGDGDADSDATPDGGLGDGDADGDADVPGDRCQTGTPIEAPADQWTWVEFADSACGDGSPAGIGIDPGPRTDEVFIYLMGGGGCWDQESCSSGQSSHMNGYSDQDFAGEVSFPPAGSIYDRSSPDNPFRDMSWIFVPYCTGDFHSGNRVTDYGVHHVGFANMTAYLRRIVPTFCEATHVVLVGSSAGGIGATLNYDQVARAFGDGVTVDLVDDCFPLMRPPWMSDEKQDELRSAWGAVDNLPADCPGCDTEWHNVVPWISSHYPDARVSFIASLWDWSIGTFFGMTPWSEQDGVTDFVSEVTAPLPNVRTFVMESNEHVWLPRRLADTSTGGVTLSAFLDQQLTGDPAWSSVGP